MDTGVEVSSYASTLPLLKAIRDVPTAVVVRYVPTDHPNREAPRTPAPEPAPVRVPAPTLSEAQIADGVLVVSLFKADSSARLGITLTSEPDALAAPNHAVGMVAV